MAKRRMISISIAETDKFYSLSASAQALYFHLNLNADDDGVVDRVKLITNQMHLKRMHYNELVLGGYIIELEEGLIVITHWHQHNQIRKERYVKGEYLDRLSSLSLQENGRFVKGSKTFLGDKCVPQYSIVKDNIVKDNIDNGSIAEYREEKKKEEKENISLFLTNNHSPEASPLTEPTESAFSPKAADSLSYSSFINAIKLYFMKKYQSLESGDFIRFYEQRDWIGNEGSITVNNYKVYIDEWMSKK